MKIDEKQVLAALSYVQEPELERDIASLEIVRDLKVTDS